MNGSQSLLSALDDEVHCYAPSTSILEVPIKFTTLSSQAPEEIEFEVITLQRMKNLRQRILDSMKQPLEKENVPTTPVSATTTTEIESNNLPAETILPAETLMKSSNLDSTSEKTVAQASSTITVDQSTPIVTENSIEEIRERSNTVDSDDELEE